MFLHTGRWALMIGATASASIMTPVGIAPAQAQGWGAPSCRGLDGRARDRCERDREASRWDRNRSESERERERRKDAKTNGVVAGVVGTVVLGGIIAAIASSGNDKKRERRAYCEDRYGNYDSGSDSYQASDGRWYKCR
jgi:hypothetical protein